MANLTATDILGTSDLRIETVNIPEWGGDLLIKEMSVKTRSDFESRVERSTKKPQETYEQVIIWLAIQSMVDEDGKRLFKDEDSKKFMDRNAKTVMKVYEAVLELNAIREDDQEDEKKAS